MFPNASPSPGAAAPAATKTHKSGMVIQTKKRPLRNELFRTTICVSSMYVIQAAMNKIISGTFETSHHASAVSAFSLGSDEKSLSAAVNVKATPKTMLAKSGIFLKTLS